MRKLKSVFVTLLSVIILTASLVGCEAVKIMMFQGFKGYFIK
jgi:hypothetical protein